MAFAPTTVVTGCAVAAGIAAIAGMAWAVRGRSSQVFGPSVHRGDPYDSTLPQLALTFDDGPSASTPQLLETLDRLSIPATFFMVGANVRRYPEIARQVAEAGHEVGNHSDQHPYLHFKSARFIEAELSTAQQAIIETTGATPRWFRAPYGVRWFGLRDAQNKLGLTGAMWTVIGRDWTLPAHGIERRLLHHAKPGNILCLHDGRRLEPSPDIGATIEAVAAAVPQLQKRGFQFVTLSQLCRNPSHPNQNPQRQVR